MNTVFEEIITRLSTFASLREIFFGFACAGL
jgi:hypothetical protein